MHFVSVNDFIVAIKLDFNIQMLVYVGNLRNLQNFESDEFLIQNFRETQNRIETYLEIGFLEYT